MMPKFRYRRVEAVKRGVVDYILFRSTVIRQN